MKWFYYLFFLLFAVLLLPSKILAQESIKDFSSKISISENASVNVEEKIIYDFGSSERRGIIREIPVIYANEEGKKFRIELNTVSVTDENGISYKYKFSENQGNKIIKIGEENKYLTGEHTYVINYIVKGVITYFSDHDELYWNVTGSEWSVPIEKAQTNINLDFDNPSLLQVACYSDCDTKIISNSQTSVNMLRPLKANEGLTFVVGFPKNLVAVVEPKQVIDFWETPLGKLTEIVIAVVAFLYYAVSPFIVFLLWYKYGRDPKVSKPVRSWYEPPKDSHGKLLRPAEVGTLVDETADNKDISATIVDLAIRGFIKIKEIKKAKEYEFTKIKSKTNTDNLNTYENKLLDAFFQTKNSILTSDLKDSFYQTATDIKNQLYSDLVTRGFFPKNPDKIRNIFYIVAFIVLITGNFLLAISLFVFGRVMPRKTIFGAVSQSVALGLKNFLTSQDRQLKFQAEKWFMFEKLLPFAIIFGVEKIWAKRFEHFALKPPTWYEGSYGSSYNSTVFTHNLISATSNFASISSPASSSRSSSGFSSGFSGGGGGGFGGGGGSSW